MRVVLQLPFKGDDINCLIAQRLKSAVKFTYYAAAFTIARLPIPSVKEPLAPHAKSNCIYQFVGRTKRLRYRATARIPVWLQKTMSEIFRSPMTRRKLSSSITQQLIEMKHCDVLREAFRILYKTNNTKVLKYAEALAIQNGYPRLCKQREWLITLAQPW
ncbi:unnamed protein product [Echinostoma caproni]|uniref:Ribosomal_S7 domain-containing protein n=1 Tax=Echinostoma caproni TaxID=27848 RepID=A0A183ASM2_9TREM|nr:unnamed protein product [Echinostoma caproni]